MAKPNVSQMLAGFAVALSVTAMVVIEIIAVRTGEVQWTLFALALITSLGAGRRFAKSRVRGKASKNLA